MARELSQLPTNRIPPPAQQASETRWNTINTHWTERWLASIGGAALGTYGLFRQDWPGLALSVIGGALFYRGFSGHSYVYQGFGISTKKRQLAERVSVPHLQGVKMEKVLTIERPQQELYQHWRHFEHLPSFMNEVQEIKIIDEIHSHWVVKAPVGKNLEWDAEIINEKENELLAWRSLPGSAIAHAGSVHFLPAPGGRGTEVRVVMEYIPPAGRLGRLIAKILGKEPEIQMREGLRHFKQMMEAGEIPSTEGQPSGRTRTQSRKS